MKTTSTGHIGGIDGLRTIAVLMVVAYHLQLPFVNGGLLGVTVFFVISGFLVTRILTTELKKTGTIDLKTFWMKRIRRLLPAILTMVSTLILVSALFNRVLFTKTCSDGLSAVLGFNNWYQIFHNVSYFENAGAPSPLTHFWSLAIETQFYLFYPLLLIFLSRFRNKKKLFVLVTLGLALVSLGLMWLLFDPTQDPSRVYYGTDTRAFSLLFGALLALTVRTVRIRKKVKRIFFDFVGLFSLATLIHLMITMNGYSSFLYRGGQGIVSILTVLVLLTFLNKKSFLNQVLSVYPFKWLGDLSYGIYLWHYPIILLISGGAKSVWWVNLIEILLTLALSALSYYLIEAPIRNGTIEKSIAVIKSRPTTLREYRYKKKIVGKSMRNTGCILALGMATLLCIAYVPRKSTLTNIDELEQQAKQAKEITDLKITNSNLLENAGGGG